MQNTNEIICQHLRFIMEKVILVSFQTRACSPEANFTHVFIGKLPANNRINDIVKD